MKILHTADIHLRKGDTKRIDVLQWLIDKGTALEIDYFIIAGDLFESDADASVLRSETKKIFEKAKAKFLIIPGNHDAKSFSHDYDYGKNVIQLTKTPFEIIELNGLTACGIPYQNKKFSECVKNIPGEIDILIAHATLYDNSFIFSILDDKETEYMPVYPTNLENLARYIAMGHLHSHSIEKNYNNTKVVYPGSPIALDTKCEDKRYFYSINIDKKNLKIERIQVDISPYWLRKELFVFPGNEQEILNEIESHLANLDVTNIMPNIIINGFIGEKDKDFKNKVDEIDKKFAGKFENMKITIDIQSWDRIIQNRMVKNFVQKTMELDDRLRIKVFEITFPIFSDILK